MRCQHQNHPFSIFDFPNTKINFYFNYDNISMLINRLLTPKPTLTLALTLTHPFTTFNKLKQQKSFFPKLTNKSTKSISPKQHPSELNPSEQLQAISNSQKESTQIQNNTDNLNLRELINNSKDIEQLLSLKEQVFKTHSELIPLYLAKLSNYLNRSTYQQYETHFTAVNEELNGYSQQLRMAPLQCVTMLHYRLKCKQFEPKYSNIANFGFQRKATLVCASLIHKKQIELNQTIFVLQALLSIGSMSVLLFMNFVKYIKSVFLSQKHQIKLEQLLTILNTNLLKRNQITLEIILYDHVLSHLLQHLPTLLLKENTPIKIEVLNLLLVQDIKKYYKTNKLTKQLWTKKLLTDLTPALTTKWTEDLLTSSEDTHHNENNINYNHILTIVECINFAKSNHLEEQCYRPQFQKIVALANQQLASAAEQYLKQRKSHKTALHQQQQQAIIRLLFNQEILKTWITHPQLKTRFLKLINKLDIAQQTTFYPLVDAINHLQHHQQPAIDRPQQQPSLKQELISAAAEIFKAAKKNQLIIWPLAAQLLEHITPQKGIDLINELSQLTSDNLSPQSAISFVLLKQYFTKKHSLKQSPTPANITANFEEQINSNPKEFINRLFKTLMNFRNINVAGDILHTLNAVYPPLSSYLAKIKVKRVLDEQAFQVLDLLFITLCANPNHTLQLPLQQILDHLLKDQVIRHQFLANCYPEGYPHPKKYHKQVNILSNPDTFKQNYTILLQYLQSPKYSYFMWDLLIKNYIRLPIATRIQCYQLLEETFLKAFEKENLRKIILLTVFTNYISSGIILAPKPQLQSLFQTCIELLIKTEEIIEYHYQCYVQIIFNAISANILSMDCFHSIIQHSREKSPDLKETTTLMLLYGSYLINDTASKQTLYYFTLIDNQKHYLRYLVKNKRLKLKTSISLEQPETQKDSNSSAQFTITGKLIGIYMRFHLKEEILQIKEQILQYLSANQQLSQIMIAAHSYDPTAFSPDIPQEKQLRTQLNILFLKQLARFKQKGTLTQEDQQQIIPKLI